MTREYPNEDGSADRDGTFVHTYYDYTVLRLDHGKFTKTFEHPSNNIPEVVVNEGMKGFNTYSISLGTEEPPVRNIQNTSVFWSNKVALPSSEIDKNSKFKRVEKCYIRK